MTTPEDECETLSLAPLPADVVTIFAHVAAPARLRAHHMLVHDVAKQIVNALRAQWPLLPFDRDDVLFGAATHDVGKAQFRVELSGPGSAHEEAGHQTLLGLGVSPGRARFARTHALWQQDSSLTLEDLLVSLADTCWKGKRNDQLEKLIQQRISLSMKSSTWDTFLWLDDVVARLAETADRRLFWQNQFSVDAW
jgi:hypothetical protein